MNVTCLHTTFIIANPIAATSFDCTKQPSSCSIYLKIIQLQTHIWLLNLWPRSRTYITYMWMSHLGHRFYNHMYGYSCIILFLHLLIHTAWWWLLCAVETCSCYWVCYNKGRVSMDYVHIIACYRLYLLLKYPGTSLLLTLLLQHIPQT
jgi:hypothetical protein